MTAHQSSAPRTAALVGEPVLAPLPGDLYGYEQLLPAEDQAVLLRLREWLQREVAPIANDHWARGEFPHQLVPSLGELGVIGLGYAGRGGRRPAGC
ncbi:MAG: hypothetical protein NVSMB13_21240 [Mycobacteriales bacterium]